MAGYAMNEMIRRLFLSLPILPVALAAGCSPGTRQVTEPPLANAKIGGPFALTDQTGKQVTDKDFVGKFRVIYFGYTYCPDVCPIDLQNVAQGMKVLEKRNPALASQVVSIFISVDPARDTPAVLKQYVGAFSARMVGLTGTPDEIAKVAKEYGIFYEAQPKDAHGGYAVTHSRVAYLFDRQGHPLALLRQDGKPEQIADDIEQWAR